MRWSMRCGTTASRTWKCLRPPRKSGARSRPARTARAPEFDPGCWSCLLRSPAKAETRHVKAGGSLRRLARQKASSGSDPIRIRDDELARVRHLHLRQGVLVHHVVFADQLVD